MIERRVRDHNRTLNPVSISLCIAGILAIAFAMTLRVIQTKLLPDQTLMHIKLSAQFFNGLNETYQYTLIATLVLSGLIVDLIGPRLVLSVAVVAAVLSNGLFHNTNSLQLFMASRFLTELSYVFTLTSVLTLGSHWLPRRHFSFFIGLVFATLLIIPSLIQGPMETLITIGGMPCTDLIISLTGMVIMLLIARTRSTLDYTRRRSEIYSHFNPLRYYKIWLIAIVAMIGWMTNIFLVRISAYFLVGYLHLSVNQTIPIVHTSFIYFGVGALVMGFASDYINKKRNIIIMCYCIAAAAFSGLLFIPNLSVTCVTVLIYAIAFFASSNIICYTKSNDYCTVENSGITMGLILSVSTIGSSLFIRALHHGLIDSIYATQVNANSWKILVIMPVLLLVAAIIGLTLAPTHTHKPPHVS
jgi:predicted MFS family arabinose efflux permease